MISSNISEVLGSLVARIDEAIKPENFTRVVATGIISTVHNRIHIQGKAADGSPIGSYENNYLRLRERKYNRLEGKKVVLSLTRQMENDFSAVVTQNGTWGLGFKNSLNADKSKWVQDHFEKNVYDLTAEEKDMALEIGAEYLQKIISSATD